MVSLMQYSVIHVKLLFKDGFFEGDYGKLGHGDVVTHKEPKLILGPFVGKVIELVSAGYRHSAAVTSDGQLYTWGEGDHGRLGIFLKLFLLILCT